MNLPILILILGVVTAFIIVIYIIICELLAYTKTVKRANNAKTEATYKNLRVVKVQRGTCVKYVLQISCNNNKNWQYIISDIFSITPPRLHLTLKPKRAVKYDEVKGALESARKISTKLEDNELKWEAV